MTSRLKEKLTSEEQYEVIRAFQIKLRVSDAMLVANSILKKKGLKEAKRDMLEKFLQVSTPYEWQRFKAKSLIRKPSVLERVKAVAAAITGKEPSPSLDGKGPHPPFTPFSDDESRSKRGLIEDIRGEDTGLGMHHPNPRQYHNVDFDRLAFDELDPQRRKRREKHEKELRGEKSND